MIIILSRKRMIFGRYLFIVWIRFIFFHWKINIIFRIIKTNFEESQALTAPEVSCYVFNRLFSHSHYSEVSSLFDWQKEMCHRNQLCPLSTEHQTLTLEKGHFSSFSCRMEFNVCSSNNGAMDNELIQKLKQLNK